MNHNPNYVADTKTHDAYTASRYRMQKAAAVEALQAGKRRHLLEKEPPQAIPYEECLRRLLNRQRTVMA